MANIVYEVAAEFIIETAAAQIATNALTQKVQGLSKTVDDAIFGAARIGAAYAKSFLTGGGGVIGILGGAINASEKFRATQIELANTIISNGLKVNGELANFNQALSIGDQIMGDIIAKGQKFGISPDALAAQTKIFSAVLAPKGLAGDNLSNASELARVTLKGAPALGIDNNQALTGATNAIFGQLSKNSQFSRIFAEAGDVIKDVSKGAITDVKSFNKASGQLRLKALIAGLDKLAGSSAVVDARAKTLTARLRVIKDLFIGVGSILKPIGDQLRRIIGPILDEFASQVKTKGKLVVGLIVNFMKRIGDSPKELLLNVRQFANLSSDIEKAGSAMKTLVNAVLFANVAAIATQTSFAQGLLAKGGIGALLVTAISKIANPISKLLGKINLASFATTLGSIAVFIARLIPLFGGLIIIFQIISKAADKARMKFAEVATQMGGQFIKQFDRLTTTISLIFQPFQYMIDTFSDWLALVFDFSGIITSALDSFKTFNDIIFGFMIAFQSLFIFIKGVGAFIGDLVAALVDVIQNPSKLLSGGSLADIASSPFEAANAQIDKDVANLVNTILRPEDGEKTVAKNINYNNINNTFNIREKIEPDRIAFTMKEQLQKLSQSPTKAKSSGFKALSGALGN